MRLIKRFLKLFKRKCKHIDKKATSICLQEGYVSYYCNSCNDVILEDLYVDR